ncbi:hypothetical protein GOP47_0026514 [Adiantum capillus-veneris]|nr:hypothetical protein GOP47_0026514 [Adiantum capillus-veneris]
MNLVATGVAHRRLADNRRAGKREQGENTATKEVVNISDSEDEDIDAVIGSDFIPLLKRTKTDVQAMDSTEAAVEAEGTQMDLSQNDNVDDAILQRLEDVLMQI